MTELLPPVPVSLQMVLAERPAKLRKLREVMLHAASLASTGAERQNAILQAIEDCMEAMVFEAMDEGRRADAHGDEAAAASAEEYVALLRRASLKRNWLSDSGLAAYFKEAGKLDDE